MEENINLMFQILIILLGIAVLILYAIVLIVIFNNKKCEKGKPGPMGPMGPMGMRGESGAIVVPIFEDDWGNFIKVKYKIVKSEDELYKYLKDREICINKPHVESENIKSAKWDSEEEAPNILEEK